MILSPGEHEVDVLIIGAGPAGLFAAYYAGFRGLTTAVVDSLPEVGGQVTAMYPEKMIYDVAGFPAIRGRDLIKGLIQQAAPAQPIYLLGRTAEKLRDVESEIEVSLDGGELVRAGAVLITAGMGEFTPRPLPAGGEWLGRGIVHFVSELDAYQGHDVVVVGGGDSAFDWALALRPIAASVTLVHRRAKFRAVDALVREARDLGIQIITDAEMIEVRGNSAVTEVILEVKGLGRQTLPAHSVIAALGFIANLGPIEAWDLALDHRAILVDTTMATNRARIYAAGDVAAYPGKVKLIATGFGEAATAINNIAVLLNPQAHLFPGHSTGQ